MPTMRKVPAFSGRSRPKCWSSGSSSLLKKRLTNASFTTATGAVVSLSAAVKCAPADDRHAEVLQVVRADAVPRRAGLLAGLRRRMPGHEDQLAPVVGERVVERESRLLDAGEAVEPLLELAIERGQLSARVGGRRPVERHDDAAVAPGSRSPGVRACRGCARASSRRRRGRRTASPGRRGAPCARTTSDRSCCGPRRAARRPDRCASRTTPARRRRRCR